MSLIGVVQNGVNTEFWPVRDDGPFSDFGISRDTWNQLVNDWGVNTNISVTRNADFSFNATLEDTEYFIESSGASQSGPITPNLQEYQE